MDFDKEKYELERYKVYSEIEQKYRQRAFDTYMFALKSIITISIASIAFSITYLRVFEVIIDKKFIVANLYFLFAMILAILVSWPGLICIGTLMQSNRYFFKYNTSKAIDAENYANAKEALAGRIILYSLASYFLGFIFFVIFILDF